jgi:hypothetical protein
LIVLGRGWDAGLGIDVGVERDEACTKEGDEGFTDANEEDGLAGDRERDFADATEDGGFTTDEEGEDFMDDKEAVGVRCADFKDEDVRLGEFGGNLGGFREDLGRLVDNLEEFGDDFELLRDGLETFGDNLREVVVGAEVVCEPSFLILLDFGDDIVVGEGMLVTDGISFAFWDTPVCKLDYYCSTKEGIPVGEGVLLPGSLVN